MNTITYGGYDATQKIESTTINSYDKSLVNKAHLSSQREYRTSACLSVQNVTVMLNPTPTSVSTDLVWPKLGTCIAIHPT